ncbi:MAG TPA: LytTR family DNA-binding domain-containing protein [Candidatus Sulfotelmatobacter sp.]|nr:LytTR family DNA-binding domain-containing protein [Candidatus Sulfotelmatobacter sp.]
MSETLRVLVVDDEALARARARRMLEEIDGVTLAGEAGSADEARRFLARQDVDVMLLDIQMPGEDAFSLLASIQRRPAVIFSTAFDQYAVRAFEENAVDYLLKPYRRERLEAALERARRELRNPEDLSRRLSEMLASLKGASSPHLERFTVRIGQRQLILRAEDVMWFGAEDKLVFAATEKDRHYVNFTLDQLEQRLDPRKFARVHRSAIVNLDWAAALRPGFAGTWRLQLRDAARTEVPVSRARARPLRERLGA